MDDKNCQKKGANFYCDVCDYTASRKTHYDQHILTDKHIWMTNGLQMDDKIDGESSENILFNCLCGKKYKYRQGLWKHKKTCIQPENNIICSLVESTELIKKQETSPELLALITELIKTNSDIHNSILELCKNNTGNINSNNNINSHNKSFNLQFFLNETCKNAMNINEFVDSIQLQLSDFIHIGDVGFVKGVSDIIIKYLNSLDITLRPIHCTDKKREVFYIKEDGKWEKEDVQKLKIRKVIKKVMDKNQRMMPKFREKYPDCVKAKSIWSDSYSKMVYEAMGGKGDNDAEKEDDIIRNIAKVVGIEK